MTAMPSESEPRLVSSEQVTAGWRITTARGPDGEFCFHEIVDENGHTLMSTWAPDDESESARLARLVIAAPALLAAAKRVLEGLHVRITSAGNSVPIFDGIADLHDAIAKAEGRTP